MKVAVVGVGRMGKWFSNYFRSRGYEVLVYDKNPKAVRDLLRSKRFKICKSLEEITRASKLILLAVPTDVMPKILKEVLKLASPKTTIIEISSIKMHVLDAIRGEGGHATVISLHPLFGHGARRLKGKTMVLVPVRSKYKELKIVKRLFKDASFIVMDAKLHDRLMAFSLGLSHAVAITLASTIDKRLSKLLWRASGTTLKLQLLSIATATSGSPDFLLSIFKLNRYTRGALSLYAKNLRMLSRILKQGKIRTMQDIYEECREKLPRDAYATAYSILEG